MATEKILVIGSSGQIGSELVEELRIRFGDSNVIASDIKAPHGVVHKGPFETLDVLNATSVHETIKKHGVKQIYLLAALLSATAEEKIKQAWNLNMNGLINLLEICRSGNIKLFWPSSIGAFGPNSPKINTPQFAVMDPTTIYGISKLAGERWCEYYHKRFGVDVRSLRYPGLMSYKSEPGGGTTDYAIHIFHEAKKHSRYECFLAADTMLPMMYMPDAIKATIDIMDAEATEIKIRSSYNIAAISFTPQQLADEIRKHIPGFKITYKPDVRQEYASSWPSNIDDSYARSDWGWEHSYDLSAMTKDMLKNIEVNSLQSAVGSAH